MSHEEEGRNPWGAWPPPEAGSPQPPPHPPAMRGDPVLEAWDRQANYVLRDLRWIAVALLVSVASALLLTTVRFVAAGDSAALLSALLLYGLYRWVRRVRS